MKINTNRITIATISSIRVKPLLDFIFLL